MLAPTVIGELGSRLSAYIVGGIGERQRTNITGSDSILIDDRTAAGNQAHVKLTGSVRSKISVPLSGSTLPVIEPVVEASARSGVAKLQITAGDGRTTAIGVGGRKNQRARVYFIQSPPAQKTVSKNDCGILRINARGDPCGNGLDLPGDILAVVSGGAVENSPLQRGVSTESDRTISQCIRGKSKRAVCKSSST